MRHNIKRHSAVLFTHRKHTLKETQTEYLETFDHLYRCVTGSYIQVCSARHNTTGVLGRRASEATKKYTTHLCQLCQVMESTMIIHILFKYIDIASCVRV